MKHAVITGAAAVTPLGLSYKEFADRVLAGESGISSIAPVTPDETFPIRAVGLLPEGFYPPISANAYDEELEIQLRHLLLQQFPEELPYLPVDGIVYGTNTGIPRFGEIRQYHAEGKLGSHALAPNHGLNFIQRFLEARGQPALPAAQTLLFSNLCITGLQAIGYATQRVQAGRNRRILVICDEVRIRQEELLRLNALGALSRDRGAPERVSRPFSASRNGFVKGEGAGLLLVEDAASCSARGAPVLASILGYGHSSDAWRMTDGREDGKGIVSAIRQALASAAAEPGTIDYVNAHGTSTKLNDSLETAAIKQVFGAHARRIPVSSLKSQIGHLNFACGMVETIACLAMFERQRVAPTLNCVEPDPDCDLFYVPEKSIPMKLDRVLKVSAGFGGANAALVLGKAANAG